MLSGCTPWPPDMAAHYRESGAWRGCTLATLTRASAERHPDRTALVHHKSRISYAELQRRIERLASGLHAEGVSPGDRVLVQLPNIPEFVIVCLALFRIDAKPVLMLPGYRESEIRSICDRSQPVAYIVGAAPGFDIVALGTELLGSSSTLRKIFVAGGDTDSAESEPGPGMVPLSRVDGPPRNHTASDPSDVAFFLLSGGTTGAPKLIPRTHDDYLCQLRAVVDAVALDESDVYLATLPAAFNFTFGCPGVLGTLYTGGTVVLSEEPDPLYGLRLVADEGVTVVSLVPTLAGLWVDEQMIAPLNTSSLRLLQVGGAPLHRELATRIVTTFGRCLQQVFGMAEGLLSMTRLDDPDDIVLGTQGRPLSDLDEIRIVDDNGTAVAPGGYGELEVRGPYTFRGYYRAPEQNTTAFTSDGFYRTGDLARVTTDGHLEVVGRRKDIVNRGGMKISAAELEGHLVSHSAVADAAVVPVADRILGQRVCACIVGTDAKTPSLVELKKHCLARGLADYKLPDYLEVLPRFPVTPLGKIDKKALEALVAVEVHDRSESKEFIR